MAKVRVHELAKEFGVESKVLMAKLSELGEFVKSASSTIEPPVVRKLREQYATAPAATPAPPAKPVAPSVAAAAAAPRPTPVPAPQPGRPVTAQTAPATAAPVAPPEAGRPAAAAPAAAAAAAAPTRPGPGTAPTAPRPGVVPGAPRPGVPAAPRPAVPGAPRPGVPGAPGGARPGNNPFMTPGSGGRPAPRPAAPGAPGSPGAPGGPRPGPGGDRPPRPGGSGGPRFTPGMMPPRPMGGGAGAPAGRPGMGGPRPAGAGAGRPGAPGAARPGGPGGRPGFGPRPGGGTGTGTGGRPGFGGAPGAGGGRPGGGPGGRGRPAQRGRKSKKQRRQEFDNMAAPTIGGVSIPRGNGAVVRLPRGASLSDMADKIGANPASLVQVLFSLGEMVTATQSCSDETLTLLGAELGYDVQVVSPEDEDRELLGSYDIEFGEDTGEDADLRARPPVVTVMGHVDHGKTKLLDAIRHTDVVAGEAGGITQHIGAYQVRRTIDGKDRRITFIDTPGHEAFTAMRARGAQVTDVAILVVAADDGVMPQTVEALNHAQAADVPIVVAVNKVDKEGANPDKVRQQLTEYGLVAEEYGGETMFVNVSARAKTGIDQLLEAVVLTADATLDLRANPDMPAQGVAIEGHLDRGRGPVATVLVQRGTLHVGDSVVTGEAYGRVRAMLDDAGQPVLQALPSLPVQVLGLTAVPGAGDSFLVVPDDRTGRQIAAAREARERNAALANSRGRMTLEDVLRRIKEGEVSQLRLILKGDVSGSVEALEDAILKIDVGEEVGIRIIDRGVGAITETNVMLAAASDAIIIGFNVRPEGKARELADREKVDIRMYRVIYQAIEEIEAALKGMLKPEFQEAQLGTAEVREVFKVPRIGNVAGSLVRSGSIVRNSKARLVRDGVVVADNLTVDSLKRFKEDAREVLEGYECGIGLGFNDIKVDDVIETYEMREKPRV